MRIIKKVVTPMKKLKKPIHALRRCSIGFSSVAFSFPGSLCRRDIKVNVTKNTIEKATAMETNAAGEPVGAESKSVGAFLGKTVVSYCGEMLGTVQLMGAELLLRAQEPRIPMKTLGPSIDCSD